MSGTHTPHVHVTRACHTGNGRSPRLLASEVRQRDAFPLRCHELLSRTICSTKRQPRAQIKRATNQTVRTCFMHAAISYRPPTLPAIHFPSGWSRAREPVTCSESDALHTCTPYRIRRAEGVRYDTHRHAFIHAMTGHNR